MSAIHAGAIRANVVSSGLVASYAKDRSRLAQVKKAYSRCKLVECKNTPCHNPRSQAGSCAVTPVEHGRGSSACVKSSVDFDIVRGGQISTSSGQVECTLAFPDGCAQPLAHHIEVGIVRKLQIVDARHNTGQVVVRCIRRLARFANDCEHRCEAFEACQELLAYHSHRSESFEKATHLRLVVSDSQLQIGGNHVSAGEKARS